MSQGYVWCWIYDPTSWLKLQKKSSWIECNTFYWSKRSWSEKTVKNSACFIVLFCGSCRQRKPIQLLNGSNCSNFQTTLLRKIPPLTLEGLNWIPSNTPLSLKIQIHFAIWTNAIQYLDKYSFSENTPFAKLCTWMVKLNPIQNTPLPESVFWQNYFVV